CALDSRPRSARKAPFGSWPNTRPEEKPSQGSNQPHRTSSSWISGCRTSPASKSFVSRPTGIPAATSSSSASSATRRTCSRPSRRAQPGYRLRSEEHTSELQSPYDLVCRLLLEKKKKEDDSEPHVRREVR